MPANLRGVTNLACAATGDSRDRRPWACLALLLAACASDGPGMTDALVRDSAGIAVVESPLALADRPFERMLASEPAIDIGVVDGQPEYQLYRVTSAARLADGTLVVANGGTQELRFFDSTGSFVKTVGGRGRGPGEYELPVLMQSPYPDSLIVFDPFQSRFSVLTLDGEFVRVITPSERMSNATGMVEGWRLVTTDNTARAGFDSPEGLIENRVVVEVIDLAGSQRDTIGVFAGPDLFLWNQGGRIGFTTVPFDVAASVVVGGDRVYVTPGRAPEIHEYDLAGRLQRIVRVQRPPEPITRDGFDAFVNAEVSKADDEAEAAELRRRYGNTPVRAVMPSFSRLILDSDGNLWAERYRTQDADSARWTVFSPSGEALGALTFSAGVRIQAVSNDHIIATRRDDLDVEHVTVWELVPATR